MNIRKYYSTIFFVLLCVLIIVLSPIRNMSFMPQKYFNQVFEKAVVLEVDNSKLTPDPALPGRSVGPQGVKLQILTGEHAGRVFDTKNPLERSHNVMTTPGLKVVASISQRGEDTYAWVYSYDNAKYMFMLLALFFVVIAIIGRINGLKSIVSLVFTGVMIIFFMMPLIFQGKNPIIIAIITASITTIATFILISGMQKKTLAAIAGTILGVTIAGIISYIFGELANLSGISMDKGEQLLYIAQDYRIQIRGLMFTAILISSLGAVMDVAMSIASSSYEINVNNPALTAKQLFVSVMNVGKDIMGTMSNTLILAFAGSSLNLMMLIWGYQMSLNQYINISTVGTEIIQGLAGSIGIILTVPLTAVISVYLIKHVKSGIPPVQQPSISGKKKMK